MLLWFLGVGVVVVFFLFRSPMLDYRLIMLGLVLPLAEFVLGGPRLLHTMAFAAALLVVVMLATRGRRLVRRRWISLPIGLFMHLVLDGVWARTEVFWWPVYGFGFPAGQLPELERGLVIVLQELVGAVALVWCWVVFRFADRRHLDEFVRTGHLPRGVLS